MAPEHLDRYYCDTELCLMTPGCRRRIHCSSTPPSDVEATAGRRRQGTGKAPARRQELQEEEQQIAMPHGEGITGGAHDLTEIDLIACLAKRADEVGKVVKHGGGGDDESGGDEKQELKIEPQLVDSGHLSIKRSLQRFLYRRKRRVADHHPYLLLPRP